MVCVDRWMIKTIQEWSLKPSTKKKKKKNRLLPNCERSFHNTVVSLTNGLTFTLKVQKSKTYWDTYLEVHVINDTTVTILYA